MWSKVREALAGPAVHTVWHPHSLGYPEASSTVLLCTTQPQETGLKILLIAPFKGSAGKSLNQTEEGKRCVSEKWLTLKATHSSLMQSQGRKKAEFWGAEGNGMDGLWLAWEHPFLKLTPAVFLFSWFRKPLILSLPFRTVKNCILWRNVTFFASRDMDIQWH